jgi:hypothetical protein
VGDIARELREIEGVEAGYRERLAAARASGDEYLERIAVLTLERLELGKEALLSPSGVTRTTLRIRACDLAIAMFEEQVEWYSSHGEEVGAELKRQALQRARQQRAEAEHLLGQQRGQTGIA